MKYVLMFYGKSAESEEARTAGMQAMAAWYGGLGSAVVDGGSPFTGAATTITPGGDVGDGPIGPMPTGYSILEADSLDVATELASSCPLLQSGRQISVYELFSPE
jgi:hypothetical protein